MKLRFPDEIKLFCAIDGGHSFSGGDSISYRDAKLTLNQQNNRLSVYVTAESTPLFHIRFRWSFSESEKRHGVRIMGDSWERSYGDLEWRGVMPHRFMPWYMLVSDGDDMDSCHTGRLTEGFGVAVRPGAFCTWQYDTHGVTLWMDIRCGGDGVLLGGRALHVCDVLFSEFRDMSAFEAGRRFCGEMCTDPLLCPDKVYGFNNWYYAVGDSSYEQILRDARLMASMADGIQNRPFAVIDDGWQINPCDGPWMCGNERFPDMECLAREIIDCGCRPGIWVRLLRNSKLDGVTEDMCLTGQPGILDPSLPQVIDYVRETVKRLTGWGYQLIKHDFTHTDMFGMGGHENPKYVTKNGKRFRDKSRTSAEIALSLYRAILEAAEKDTVILACNTPSHLTAGLAHLMRTGFDTSGRHFERTRICGVNTLAFRLMQNGTFYAVDADCCSHTGRIDWRLNRQWLRLLSDSGTALFISSDPDKTADEQLRDMIPAVSRGALQQDEMIPLDWMQNQTPEVYLVNGEVKNYCWYNDEGTHQFIPPTDPEY